MAWENIKKMFPSGYASSVYGNLSIEEIIEDDYETIESYIITPARSMIENQEKVIFHSNGDMERYFIYSVQPRELIDGVPLLSVYGQKGLNEFLKRKGEK